MKKIYTLLIFFMATIFVSAQTNRMVTGKVTDAEGIGLPGVTIQLVGSQTGTISDIDGNYRLNVSQGILRFSYIGFISQDIKLAEQSILNVVLIGQAQTLNEVVVVGYGTQKKKDLSTAVSIVGEKELKGRPIVSAAQAIQGKAAGVQVVQPSGKPGSALSVRVRGATSVLAGNEPLYVVDGVWTNDVKGLNANDISSMSVLKDASATAIYGARGANGVVLITTKRGVDNTPAVSFNSYFGISKLRKTIEVLDTKQYRDLMNEIIPGGLDPSATDFNNWSDKVFGTGSTQSYQFSVSGGDSKSRYFISGGYLSDEGIVKPAKFNRYTLRLNLDNEVRPWLKITTSINVMNLNTKDTPDNASSGRGGVIMSTLNTPPFLNVYKQDGSGWFDPNPFQPSWENPIAYMEGPDQEATDKQLQGNINAEAKLMKGLYLKSRAGVEVNTHQWDYYLDPFRTNYGRQQNGVGRSDKYNGNTWQWENLLDYSTIIGKHRIAGLAGNSIQKFQGSDSYIEGNDFPANTSVRSIWAANIENGGTSQSGWANSSFFGRVMYDYNSRYYLTASIRRDGSSKLANRWGTLPSFSAAWRISSESFMEDITFIDDLKFRGGWGKVGNEGGLSNYARYGIISYYRRDITNPLSGPGSYLSGYGNPDLRWETTAQTNIGFDLTILNSRVTVNFDAYYKKTTDELLDNQLTTSLNPSYIQTNSGSLENRGIEFNINTINIDKEVNWSTDFNMSFNRNKVLTLDYTPVFFFGHIYSNNSDVTIVKEGLPLGTFYGYVSEGVDPLTGDIIYKDVNLNGIFDPGDRTVIGSGEADFTFGLTNSVSYKRFDLNVFFQGSYGNDIFNATRIDLEGMFDSKNQSTAVLRRWTPENTITDIPRAVGKGNVDNVRNSSRFVEDGSYIRLKSMTLSYIVLDSKANFKAIKKLSVYATGQNLLTFTKYSGFDPEVNAYGNSATEIGIDYGTYPQARSLILGLNVEF